jgi:hypothetical protein
MSSQGAEAICPSCRSPNAGGARFCGNCGAPMHGTGAGVAPPPQPPPAPPASHVPLVPPIPPMPPMSPAFQSSRFGSPGMMADSLTCTAPLALPQALEHVTRVITSNGGRVMPLSQTALQVEVPYKDFWTTGGMKVAYRGVLNFTSQGPQQTLLQGKLSLDWNSAIAVLSVPLVCAFVAGMASVYFFMIWIFFGAGTTALGAWMLSGAGPRKCGDKLAAALASGGRL